MTHKHICLKCAMGEVEKIEYRDKYGNRDESKDQILVFCKLKKRYSRKARKDCGLFVSRTLEEYT